MPCRLNPTCISSVRRRASPGIANFTTSTARQAQIPPESPRFIEVPRPVQPSSIHRPWMKGVLPVPRKLFTPDPNSQVKTTPSYLASVTPEPLRNRSEAADPRTKDFVEWKVRQSQLRRQNLRQGLVELQHRDKETLAQVARRSARVRALNRKARDRPEREDSRLTNPSVLVSGLPGKDHGLPDPGREARLRRKRENVEKTKALQEDFRRQKLHTLYVNAGNFITTGAQLNETIDKVFDDNEQFRSESTPGLNIWNLGLPETVQELLGKNGKGVRIKAVDEVDANAAKTRARMKKITEELTGGKLEEAR